MSRSFDSPVVFISYRRSDSSSEAGRLSSDLDRIFGENFSFQDNDIQSGDKWINKLEEAGRAAKVILVLIGDGWLEKQNGQIRLFDENDWVRKEIVAAINAEKVIIPILIDGVSIPKKSQLPVELHSLLEHQAFSIRSSRWEYDLPPLIQDIKSITSYPTQEEKKVNLSPRRITIFSLVILVLLFCSVFIFRVIGGFIQTSIKPDSIIFQDTSGFNILLLPFGPDGTCELEKNMYHHQVHRRLLQRVDNDDLDIEVVRLDTIMCDIVSSETVLEYGKSKGADMVIYGNYQERCSWDTTLINISYVYTEREAEGAIGETGYRSDSDNTLLSKLREGAFTGDIEDMLFFFLGVVESNNGDYASAIRAFDEIKEMKQDTTRWLAINIVRAAGYFNLEDFDSAIKYLDIIKNEKLVLEDEDFRGYIDFLLGFSYSSLGKYEKAIDAMRKYNLPENRATAYYMLADAYYQKRDFENALHFTNEVIALDGQREIEQWILYMQRGYLFEAMDSISAAIDDMNTAVRLNPDCTQCKDFRADLLNLQFIGSYTD